MIVEALLSSGLMTHDIHDIQKKRGRRYMKVDTVEGI